MQTDSPFEGPVQVAFRIMDAEAEGEVLWPDGRTLALDNGF